jgi:hypothetical protein
MSYDVNSLLNLTWWESFNASHPGHDFNNATVDDIYKHQEGTTLYDNKAFLKLFKIAKKYKFELLPGQKAVLNMKDKYCKKLNVFKQILQKSYMTTKGQVFFILQLQGAVGHQSDWGEEVPPDQNEKYFNGLQSRPNIGIMPAAVDVMCIKNLKAWVVPNKMPRVRNIIRVSDYYDDEDGEAIDPAYFKDSAPSDYADSAAVIG